MSRAAFALALLGTLAGAARLPAQAPSPFDLARGLRDAGLPELALEYLKDVEAGKPPKDVLDVIPLERAKARLQAAEQEDDEGAKDAAVAAALAEFQKFLKDHAKHPRAPDASLSLARVSALQARTQLGRIGRLPPEQKPAAMAAARPKFQEAARLFGQASQQLAALIADKAADPGRKREAMAAELDRGVNQLRMADTFDTTKPAEVEARGKAIADAQTIFNELWKRDPNSPVCWVARAYLGACSLEVSDRGKATELFANLRTEAARFPAGADGVRMADFFETRQKYLETGPAAPIAGTRQARTQVKQWLDRDRYKPKMTPERLSATYYHAVLTLQEAKQLSAGRKEIAPSARPLLAEANAEFKVLAESENQYTDLAARNRTEAIRYLVGNADQPADKFPDFEQAQMAALVQLYEANQKDVKEDEKARRTLQAVALLERCRVLAARGGVAPKEANDAAFQLAYAYLNAGEPQRAAVLGEHLARTAKPAATAAKGGFIAVQGYLAALAKLPEDADEEVRAADRERAAGLARYLDVTYPNDPLTDAVRYRLGRLYFEDKDHKAAFDVLAKIAPTYAGAAAARLTAAQAAYQLVAKADSPLSAEEKAKVFRKATADADAVPEPTAAARADDVKLYLGLRAVLAQLYIVTREYAKAEQIAADAARKAAGFPQLDASAKKAAGFAAEEVRLRAVYGQAYPFFRDAKYPDLATKLAPALGEMAKSGPANQNLDGDAALAADTLDRFRQEIITLALQGAIRSGGAGAGELFDLLEKFGGSTDVLVRLVAQVRPQLEELRKAKKAEEADKLAGGIVGVLDKEAAKPKLAPRTQARLGQAMRTLGANEKAIALLEKVPAPPRDVLMKPAAQVEKQEDRDAAATYQSARLELARAYRGSKQLDKAGEVLKDALGDEKAPGWAKALEFRKEAVFLLEDRADAAPAAEKGKMWKEATAAWRQLVTMYQQAVTRPPKDAAGNEAKMDQWRRDREKLVPIYLVLYADYQKCLARGNSQIIADPAKRAERLAKLGGELADLEKRNESSLTAEVKAAFAAILTEYPAVAPGYEKAGGKAFLPGGQ